MSVNIHEDPPGSGIWRGSDGREYVDKERADTVQSATVRLWKSDTSALVADLKQARMDASWEKQRGDRYRARALALLRQLRSYRISVQVWHDRCAHLRELLRNRTHKAERERAAIDRLRLEALQEVERLKARVRVLQSVTMCPECGPARTCEWCKP